MKKDVLKLIVELTKTITAELNDSEKIASLLEQFERRGLQAGIEVQPFVRPLSDEPATSSTEENAGKHSHGDSTAPRFSAYDLKFLKTMRIRAIDTVPEAEPQAPPESK